MTISTTSEISFKELLVASDFSDATTNAIAYAKAIAKRFGSHIVLAHVSDPSNPIPIPEGGWVEDDGAARVAEEVEAAGVALRTEGFSADAVNVYGSVRDEIQALTKAHHADLIVMGTHGRRGLNRLLFGSEAEGVLRHSGQPVLIVGPSAVPTPQEEWAPKNILCATSLNPGEAKVVAYGHELARNVGAALTLFYVVSADQPSDDEQAWHVFEDALAKVLPVDEIAKHQIRSPLAGKSPAENIVDVARNLKPDLLIMGAKAVNFNVTHLPAGVLAQVLVDAPCPVLTIGIE